MCNLEELKKCRIVRYNNACYLVQDNGEKWSNLESGVTFVVDEQHYKTLESTYKTYNDFLNGKPYYINEKSLLSNNAKKWIRHIIESMVNVDFDSFRLMVENNYVRIMYDSIYEEDFIALPKTKFVIFDFNKLEKYKEYTFKELGI